MSDFPNQSSLFKIGRDEILAKNAKLRRDVVERSGSDANILVSTMSAIGDEVVLHLIRMCSGQFLDSARGQYLRRLAFDRYGISAKSASASVGSVSFSTTVLTVVPFNIPVGTKVQTSDGRQFATSTASTFPANSTGPVVVPVQSLQAGLSQQAKAGTITRILSTITGAPSTLAVNNTLATSGGADAESDDDLIARAKAFWVTARRGTLAAIREAALAVPGVKRAATFEVLDESGRPLMRTQLVITDEFTDSLVLLTTTPPAYETQSQMLAEVVYASLDDVRAAGAHIDVYVAQVVLQSVQLALSFDTSADVDVVALNARAAVVNYVNGLAPRVNLTPANIIAALRFVPGLVITGSEVVSPAGTVVPAALQVLRTTLQMVSTISTNPNRALQTTLTSA